MEKLYYTIGETAAMLSEESSTIRFWTNTFSRHIRPERNAKGNRLYRSKDIDNLKLVQHLVREEGMTLDGVARRLDMDKDTLERKMKIVGKLKDIRSILSELQNNL